MFSPKPAMLRFFVVLELLTMIAACHRSAGNPALEEVTDDKYKPGQVWSYQTRPSEPDSTLTIVRTVQAGDKRLIFVEIESLKMGCNGRNIASFMVFTKAALDSSVIANINSKPVADLRSAFSSWQNHWNQGKARFREVPVRDGLNDADKLLKASCG